LQQAKDLEGQSMTSELPLFIGHIFSVGEYQWYMYHDTYHDTRKVSSIKYHDTFLVKYQYQYHWYILSVPVSKIA